MIVREYDRQGWYLDMDVLPRNVDNECVRTWREGRGGGKEQGQHTTFY